MSSVNRLRIGLHALMFLLGLVLAYDYLKQPSVFSYLLASILFLAYSALRLYGPLKGARSAKQTSKSEVSSLIDQAKRFVIDTVHVILPKREPLRGRVDSVGLQHPPSQPYRPPSPSQ